MKKHYTSFIGRIGLIILSAVLFFVFNAEAQSFQIKWGMNNTLAGSSTSSNFTAVNAALSGAVPHQLGAYLTDGNGGQAFRSRNWPVSMSNSSYIEVSFSANAYEYNVTSLSFRTKRSATGPQSLVVRSGYDNYASVLYAYNITNSDQFYQVTLPLQFVNISDNTFTFRIYGFSSSGSRPDFGTLYFDEIIINGEATAIILPVNLTFFNASYEGKQVYLAWETAWERNSKEFSIERSTNLLDFFSIANVEAAGEASGRRQYNFVDEMPLTGVSYYRLKMVDRDANYSYSKTRDITIHSYSASIQVFPNPASSTQITIYKNNIDPSYFTLTTIAGHHIPFEITNPAGNYLYILPVQPLPSGLYILSSVKNGVRQHAKVLVP